ncbi:MAG: protease inhibitor I9 family protein [Ilumatobacter sp.]
MKHSSKTRRWGLAIAAATGVAGLIAVPASADPVDESPPSLEELAANRYVVIMSDAPNVTEFGVDGLDSTAAQDRSAELEDEQEAVAAAAGLAPADITQQYTTSLNGFAAELSDAQVETLTGAKGVMMVLKDQVRYPQTSDSIEFLGLNTQGGGIPPD